MAMRSIIKTNNYNKNIIINGLCKRFNHAIAISPNFTNLIDPISSPSLFIPETEPESGFRVRVPGFDSGLGSMDLMAVPKKKISKSRRGIRNGPKALKPIPVIVRCTCCGRVKLPHFYCCGGRREGHGERTDATN